MAFQLDPEAVRAYLETTQKDLGVEGVPDALQFYVSLLSGEVPRYPQNPVPRPEGLAFGSGWFSATHTVAGNRVVQGLGVNSGYGQEYLNWYPVTSYLFDLVGALTQVLLSAGLSDSEKVLLLPFLKGSKDVLELATANLEVLRLKVDKPELPIWNIVKDNIRLQGLPGTYVPATVREQLRKVEDRRQIATMKVAVEQGQTSGGGSANNRDAKRWKGQAQKDNAKKEH